MMKGSILQNQFIFPLLREEFFYFLLLSCSHAANKVNKWTDEFLLAEVCLNKWILKFLGQPAFWESSVKMQILRNFNNLHYFPL